MRFTRRLPKPRLPCGLAGARLLAWLLPLLLIFTAHADLLDEYFAVEQKLDEVGLDLAGGRWTADQWKDLEAAWSAFGTQFHSEAARTLWSAPLPEPREARQLALNLGEMRARLQHAAALEMINCLNKGDLAGTQTWRALIALPKYASAVEGALALQRMGAESAHQDAVARLLAHEAVSWQATRAREKIDELARLVSSDHATPLLVANRAAEIQSLAEIPPQLITLADPSAGATAGESRKAYGVLQEAITRADENVEQPVAAWRIALEAGLPNLLSDDDVARNERIVLKLLRLIPMEYQAGVRDGEIVIPIEYREAKTFSIQVQRMLSELLPIWARSKADAVKTHGARLREELAVLEKAIAAREAPRTVENSARTIADTLRSDFGMASKRAGKTADVVAESVLEIRALLSESLQAARAGQTRKAEAARLDAYINFDLEIEARTLPRDPSLALEAEKTFLEGSKDHPGIKAALDGRLKGAELDAAYERALAKVDECAALLQVGLSPPAAIASAVLIISREGLEAVVILAALLAGLRGPENKSTRRRIAVGAWLAVGMSCLLFLVSQSLLSGLSRYGELLEAVISIIAVAILLMVTNWVFHKFYWTGWNARIRDLSRAAQRRKSSLGESIALVGVGFVTIFREGFETTLFMQSLILEAGMQPVLVGIAIGSTLIAALGFAVFAIGAKLPYRRMLVVTGVLVVFVLMTFVGSTVRLFQTIGWLPVHPIPGLELPAWIGLWLGIHPTWEGLLIPLSTFAYVGGMWLWVRLASARANQSVGEQDSKSQARVASLPVSPRIFLKG